MRFLNYFQDYITEARYYSDEKFNWVAQNIGTWILDSTIETPSAIKNLPLLPQFKEWLASNTTKPTQTNDDIILATDYLDRFLNQLSPRDSQKFMKEAMERFPLVKSKIVSYLKTGKPSPEDTDISMGKRRGRPLGTKNKPKIDLSDPSIRIIKRVKPEEPVAQTQLPTEPVTVAPTPEPEEPSKEIRRGRPKVYSDDLSPMDRNRFKMEGEAYIAYLESKKNLINNKIEQFNRQLEKIQAGIEKRKKFWDKD